MKAIRLPGCDGYILNRARDVLKLYYDPSMSDLDRAAMLDEYSKALIDLPKWSVAHGFDTWVKARHRRPSPGEIRTLANAELKRYSDVIENRRRLQGCNQPAQERVKPSATDTQAILDQAGFNAKRNERVKSHRMATTTEQLDDTPPKRRHWTETADPDGPQMAALHKEREGYKFKTEEKNHRK